MSYQVTLVYDHPLRAEQQRSQTDHRAHRRGVFESLTETAPAIAGRWKGKQPYKPIEMTDDDSITILRKMTMEDPNFKLKHQTIRGGH